MAKKKLSKGKKFAIIAGCAAAAEAAAGVALTIAAPFTGGATAPLAAALYTKAANDSGKVLLIAAGAFIAGAGAGTVVTKKMDADKEPAAYGKGYDDASKTYEAKFTKQAEEFAAKEAAWSENEAAHERSSAEKDALLKECLKYINDLEKERDALKAENKKLSKEKEELLDKLYGIKRKLTVV